MAGPAALPRGRAVSRVPPWPGRARGSCRAPRRPSGADLFLPLQRRDVRCVAVRTALEGGRTGDQHVGPGVNALASGGRIDPAVYLEVNRAPGLLDHLAHRFDLAKLARD